MGSDWQRQDPRRRAVVEAANAASSSIRTIELLCDAYDKGEYHVSRELCSVLSRLIDDELKNTGRRRSVRLPTLTHPFSDRNLIPQFAHVAYRLGGNCPLEVLFFPAFSGQEDNVSNKNLKFSEWWNEPVIIEGAGGMSGLIPLKASDQIPFAKRRKLVRREVVSIIRNKMGAHYDKAETEGVRFLMKWDHAIEFGCKDESGNEYSSSAHSDKFIFLNSHGDAIVRSISEEVLRSNIAEVLADLGA